MSDNRIDTTDEACLRAFTEGDREEAKRLVKEVRQPNLLVDKHGARLVHWAAYKGWLDIVKILIEECKSDPMCVSRDDHRTPLNEACAGGHLNVVKYLITQCNCDPMYRDNDGDSPLYTASSKGHLEVIKYLINECNCDPNDNNNHYGAAETPLHSACYSGHIDVVRYFIEECKCDPMFKRNDGFTPLHQACAGGDLNVVKYLITQCNFDPMCNDIDGDSPFYTAISEGHLEVIKYLINECNCDPHDDNNQYGAAETPLHIACYSGHIDVVRYFIEECKCDPKFKRNDGFTPLHQACAGGHLNVVKYLITQCNFDPMCRDNDEDSPLYTASFVGHLEVIKYLINECNCDPNDNKNQNGSTPLHTACYRGHIDVVCYFIEECKCDPMCTTNNGDTPLHSACQNGQLDVVQYLVSECKCDPMCKNNSLQTPVSLATNDVNKYLVSADVSSPQDGSEQPLVSDEVNKPTSGNIEEDTTDDDSKSFDLLPADVETKLNSVNQQQSEIDYRPYLEEAAKRGTVKSKRTSLGIVGASGVGKTSVLKLLLNQPPVLQHYSTPVARPLKGIWMVSNQYREWRKESTSMLHKAIANSVTRSMKNEQANDKKSPSNLDKKFSQSLAHSKTERDSPTVGISSVLSSDSLLQSSFNIQTTLDLPATKLVADILESGQDHEYEEFHFVDLIDSGGQAPFIDIAPSLYPYKFLNLVIFKLNEPLDSEIIFNYSRDEKLVSSEKRKITTEQLITAVVSSKTKVCKPELEGLVHVYSKSSEKPLCMMLGTYFDRYKENLKKLEEKKEKKDEEKLEKLEEKNERLKIVLKKFKDVLIPNGADIIFPLNTLSRDKETQKMAETIRELASECYAEVEVPVTWYLFQIAIEELKLAGDKVVPLSTFLEIGKDRNMDEKQITAALYYLHNLNVCLYYPQILPRVVFTSPQYLFDKISEILAVSLDESEKNVILAIDMNARETLVNTGVFTKEFLTRLPSKFLDIFSADDFLKLMHHLHIITPHHESGTFFLPCLLKIIDDPVSGLNDSIIKPLLFSWNKAVPHGLFTSLVSWLHGSQLQLAKSDQHRNKITFNCPELACQVIIFEYPTFIGLTIVCCSDTMKCSADILETVEKGINTIVKDFKWLDAVARPEKAYLCKIPECDLEYPHLCHPDKEHKYMSCYEKDDHFIKMKLTCAHLAWFGQKEVCLEENTSVINKSLSKCIRAHTKDFCHVLTINTDALLLLNLLLFSECVIDRLSKQSIMEEKGVKRADLLLDLVRNYLDGDEDDTTRRDTVMKCFEEVECLRDVLIKMRRDLDDSSTNILQRKPLLNDVHERLKDKSTRWNDIGRKLNVPMNVREVLRKDPTCSNDERLEIVLDKWLQQGGDSCTWDKLMKSLSELVGFSDNVSAIVEEMK